MANRPDSGSASRESERSMARNDDRPPEFTETPRGRAEDEDEFADEDEEEFDTEDMDEDEDSHRPA